MRVIQPQLTNPALNAEINDNGYVLYSQLFSGDEVKQMLDLYNQNHIERTNHPSDMWNSLYDIDRETGITISHKLMAIIQPKLDNIMVDFKAPVASLMSKNYGDKSDCALHRDTSAFDENRFEYFNIWIPLVDTYKENGTIYFLKGSHKLLGYPRPPALSWYYKYLTNTLMPQAETVNAKAGDCIIFLGKVLHGSYQNHTKHFRPVVFVGAVHPEAELLFHFYDNEKNEVRAYAVPHNFYFGKDFSEPVGKYPHRLTFEYKPPHFEGAEIAEKLKQLG